MDEAELQDAMEIAVALLARGEEVTDDDVALVMLNPRLAAEQMRKLAAGMSKLGLNTIRPRTRTAKGITPMKP